MTTPAPSSPQPSPDDTVASPRHQQQLRKRGTSSTSASSSATETNGVARRMEIAARGPSVMERVMASGTQSPSPKMAAKDVNAAAFHGFFPESATNTTNDNGNNNGASVWHDADYCLYFELVRGAEDETAHGVVDTAAALLRDLGCHVRVFPLQEYDAEIPAQSRDETRAYVVTICSAFITASPTKSSIKKQASSTTTTRPSSFASTAHNAMAVWTQALPLWITEQPSFRLVAPLAGSARSQRLSRLILKEFRLEKDVHLSDGTLVFHKQQRLLHELLRYDNDETLRMQVFPLHRDSERDRLVATWNHEHKFMLPLTDIFQYFGPKLAMYFTWLEFYTEMLVVPAMAGVFVTAVSYLFATQSYWLPSLVLSVYTSVFVDRWRRRQREVEFKWKYRQLMETDAVLDLETRPQFHGEWINDQVSKQRVYDFSRRKRFQRQLLAIPLIVGMCALVGAYVVALHLLSDHLRALFPVCFLKNQPLEMLQNDGLDVSTCLAISYGPGFLNAAIIQIMDILYQKLARRLNEYENYRTIAEFDEHLVLKRMPFHFVNSNASLWFLALYVQDLDRVRDRLWILMVLMQVLDNVKELGLPFLASLSARLVTTQGRRRPSAFQSNPLAFLHLTSYSETLQTLPDYLQRVLTQKRQSQYVDTFADYKEMMVQFGYVALYTPIFPLAPVCAYLNNIVELRSDFYKLANSNGFQRPLVQHTHGIGAWERVLVSVAAVAVVINCAIVWIFEFQHVLPQWSELHRFMLLIACEHVVFAIKGMLNWVAADVPTWIQNEKRIKSLTITHAKLLSPRQSAQIRHW